MTYCRSFRSIQHGIALLIVILFLRSLGQSVRVAAVFDDRSAAAGPWGMMDDERSLHKDASATVTIDKKTNSAPRSSLSINNKSSNSIVKTAESDTGSNHTDATCYSLNSELWINSTRRYSNMELTDDNNNNNQIIQRMIVRDPLQHAKSLLGQTMAHPRSRLLNIIIADDGFVSSEEELTMANATSKVSDELLQRWATRLIYLVVYQHQHRPALSELELRMKHKDCSKRFQQQHNMGNFDFECAQGDDDASSTKYLAVSLWHAGIGANLNHIVIPAFMAGLATNRTVLLVNHLPGSKRALLKQPWPLASCQPRRDYQCIFAPPTPCVPPSLDSIINAYQLTKSEKQTLFRHGALPAEHAQDKVLYMLGLQKTSSMAFGGQIQANIRRQASIMLEQSSAISESQKHMLRTAVNHYISEGQAQDNARKDGGSFRFEHANSILHRALLLYATRPNQSARQKLDEMHQAIIYTNTASTSTNGTKHNSDEAYDAIWKHSVGLPIRASDKCERETECMPFLHHLEASSKVWKEYKNNVPVANPARNKKQPFIIFTTESRDMVKQQSEFRKDDRYPSMQFVTNTLDVLPDTGRFNQKKATDFSADQAMLASLGTLQLQLLARVTVANCCSNFHLLLHHFLAAGAGAAPSHTFRCLQDDDDPLYRPCCWNGGKCSEARQRELQKRGNSTASHSTADLHWLT